MPLKIRNKLLVAFLGLIAVMVAVGGIVVYYDQLASDVAVRRLQAVSGEVIATANLGHSLEHAIMPANDYLITGNRRYADDFKKVSAEMEGRLIEANEVLDRLHALGLPAVENERVWLNEIKTAWQNIKEISTRIFEIPDPVGNTEGAKLMEEMDYRWAGHATNLIHEWHEMDTKEYGEAVASQERTKRLSWSIMSASGILLVALGGWFAVFYARLFVRPIEAIHNGADAIARGDFKTRLDIKTGDEVEQLSNAMNEMAEQLDTFTSNLQGMVEERTRELKESEERYRGIFEKTPNAMVIFDAETRCFENVNRGAIDLYGYTEEEFLSLTPMDVSAEVEKTKKAVQNGLAEKSVHVPIRYHKKKDGTVFPIEIFMGTFLSKGRLKGFAVIVDLTENKKNEEMLMESRERYRVLGATAPNAIICLKAPDTITFWNRRAAEIFGYSEEEAVGRPMHALIVPERYREKAGEGMKRFFVTGTGPVVGKRTELSALRRDGTEFPIELSLSAMNIGGEWQATGIVRDITDRKQAEEALRNSEVRFRQLFEVGNDAVFVHGMTPDGKPTNFIEVNEIACKRLGYTREELLKMSPLDIDATEMANQSAAVIEGFLSDKKAVFEMVHVAKDGKHIPVEISSRLFELKGQPMALSIARDITARKMAEAVIRQERDRAQMYLDVAGVMFVAIDFDEKVILVNKKGCEVLGCRHDEIIGRNWFNTFIPEISRGDVKGAFTKLISGKDGSVEYFENPVLRKDGVLRIIAWHNAVIRNEAGDIVATFSSGEDITERKKAEEELKKNIDELERFQKITVKREFRIKELNDEVKALKLRLELLEKK